MNHLSLDEQAENVRQFLLSLSLDREGTILESSGRPVVCVVPLPVAQNGHHDEPWTDAKNDRRCDLIDRQYSGEPLTPGEIVELDQLQQELDRYVDRVAPIPLEATRKFHQELLLKAGQKTKT